MKKALTICFTTIVTVALIAGAACCGIVFSNDKLIYNALTNNTNELASHYSKATKNVASKSYYDITFENTTDNQNSNIIVYKYNDDVSARVKIDNDENVFEYSTKDNGSAVYSLDGRRNTIEFEDVIKFTLNSQDEDIPYIDVLAKDVANILLNKPFNSLRFKENLVSTEPVLDITVPMMGVKYTLDYKDDLGQTMYTITTVVDNYYQFHSIIININNKVFNVVLNKVNNTSVL